MKNARVLQSSAKTGFMDVPEHHGLSLGQRAVSRNALGHGLGDRGGPSSLGRLCAFSVFGRLEENGHGRSSSDATEMASGTENGPRLI